MKLQFLGTAAFEGIPALFCDCEDCTQARRRGGKNIRTRTQAIVDDTLLIDFPADTYYHFLKYGLDMVHIQSCIITHSHSDHFYPEDIMARLKGFSNIKHNQPLNIYSGRDGYEKMVAEMERLHASENDVKPIFIKPFQPFETQGFTVTALNATHSADTSPYIYLIEKDGKAMLYSHDSDDYPSDTWEYLQNLKNKTIHLVSFDCTNCENENTYVGHMGIPACKRAREKMIDMGIVNQNTKYILNHFSHNGLHSLYDDIIKTAEQEEFEVSYDGMTVEF